MAQKNHHAKLFQANALENVPPGMLLLCPVMYTNTQDLCNIKFPLQGQLSTQKSCIQEIMISTSVLMLERL